MKSLLNKTTNLSLLTLTIVALNLNLSSVSQAQSEKGCESEPPSQSQKVYNKKLKLEAEDMGIKLRSFLMEHAETAALVSRAGADLSDRDWSNPERHKYSHTGIAVKDPVSGKWKFVHELNDCSGPNSKIYEQGLAEFFMDDPFMMDVEVIFPSKALQEKISAVIFDKSVGSKGLARALHNRNYSNIAYPFGNEYQNSNMWVLNIVAAAQSGLKSIEKVQKFYQSKGFEASLVHLSGLEKTFGEMFTENAKVEDHPQSELSSGWFRFASSASLLKYMKRTDVTSQTKTLCHAKGCDLRIKGTLIAAPKEQD